MESGEIKNSAIKTGEGAVLSGKEGYYARLHYDKAWCTPNIPGHTGPGEFKKNIYVEVTFSGRRQVSAMALQGERQYSYGEYIRILYEYNGQFYFHKIGGTNEVRLLFLSPYLGNNGIFFIKEFYTILEFSRFPSFLAKMQHI